MTDVPSLNHSLLDVWLNSFHSNVCRIEINQQNQAFSLFYEFRNSVFGIQNSEFEIVRWYGNEKWAIWAIVVFYPVPNRIYVRVCCDLYEYLWLHFLSIAELTIYSCTKHWKAFYRSTFSFVAGLHNVGLMLLPISGQYYPVSTSDLKWDWPAHSW